MSFAPVRPILRRARGGDAADIDSLLRRSFGGDAEAKLMRGLDADDDITLTVVGHHQDQMVAVANFARVEIRGEERVFSAAALAPVAVAPEHRGQGVGSAIVRVGLAQVRRRGAEAVLARGPIRFFGRFGFSRFMVEKVVCAWPADDFIGLALEDDVEQLVGDAYYPRAFFGEGLVE